MTDLSRSARSRRGGRRPGWLLLTVLLVLAIAASSALVFTERVELLKLAVILSLWAAAMAAFVSVIYRRQSDIDRARARDLKLVYDLQLDREISARREYELEVESQLRRELAADARAQAADEVSALRAELAALRTNLEIMFDTDLSHRRAIETERTTVRAYSDWQRDTDPRGRSDARFVASAPRNEPEDGGAEDAIIDVPEEPAMPDEAVRVDAGRQPFVAPPEPEPATPPGWVAPPPAAAEPPGRHAPRSEQEWQPVSAGGEWLPPDTPGSNWAPTTNGTAPPPAPEQPNERRGRHSARDEAVEAPAAQPSARHTTERDRFSAASGWGDLPRPEPPPPPPPPGARHVAADDAGQTVAELLARFQASAGSTGGGRRRRRDG